MGTYKSQVVGDILANAPIIPQNFLDISAGILCRCESGVNALPNAIVTYTATIALSTAPAVKIVEGIAYVDNNGDAQVFTFSKQYLTSTLITAATIAEMNAEVRAFAAQYLVGAGNASVVKSGSNLVIKITARQPFVATSVTVDGVAVAFV
jgi:hypothetical protein